MRGPVGELTAVRLSPGLRSQTWPRGAAIAVRRALGLLSLAAVVYLGASIATGTAATPTRRVPSRLGGFPAWLRGPLDGVSAARRRGSQHSSHIRFMWRRYKPWLGSERKEVSA